ncbi:MAG: hypothetical protein ACQEQE_06420 [Bacillota bacterium]
MYNLDMFIKYIKKDEEDRILISVQDQFKPKLKEDETRQEIKKILTQVLEDNFKQLEIGKNILRITVNKNPDEAIKKINEYIEQMMEMAQNFMDQMQNDTN